MGAVHIFLLWTCGLALRWPLRVLQWAWYKRRDGLPERGRTELLWQRIDSCDPELWLVWPSHVHLKCGGSLLLYLGHPFFLFLVIKIKRLKRLKFTLMSLEDEQYSWMVKLCHPFEGADRSWMGDLRCTNKLCLASSLDIFQHLSLQENAC